MNLPDYFLADLPAEATLTEQIVRDACQSLRRNREQYLASRSTASLIRTLGTLAANWLEPDFPFRKLALESGPAATGFSGETLAAGLDSYFSRLTEDALRALVLQEFGHVGRLDSLSADERELRAGRAACARGPELLVHITGGVLPEPVFASIVHGLLLRSAQFVKCASGTALLPRLFAHSLYDLEPKLGACLEIAAWKGGTPSLDGPLLAEASTVTATGRDETLAAIRAQLPAHVRLAGYGHRVSFGYVAQESLVGAHARGVARAAARDVAAWDQLGCLSSHVLYVETGGGLPPEGFGALLAEELDRLEKTQPRGPLATETAASIATRRSFYEVRAAHSPDTKLWSSADSTAWTVVYENDPLFQVSCLHRFVYVKAVADLTQALHGADAVRGQVSTVGLAAPEHRATGLAQTLARWGVTRICPPGRMQEPPLTWRHDGRPALGDLVSWTDWEQ